MYKICGEIIKFIEDAMEKLESGTDNGGKQLSRGENLEKYLPGRWAITITICNNDDVTQSPTIHEPHQTIQQKQKRIWNPNTGSDDIVIYEAFCFDAAQGRMNGVPNETGSDDI